MKFGVVPADRVGLEDGVEQRHVRGIGGHAGVEQRVVGQVAVGPDPQALVGLRSPSPCFQGRSPMWRWSIGWGRANQSASSSRQGASRSGRAGELLGAGHVGHGELVVEPVLVDVERGGHVEDGLAVLDGHHPPGGEGPAVADAVHLVEDGDARVARAAGSRSAASGPGPARRSGPPPSGPGRPPDRRRPAGAPPWAGCPGRCSPRWARGRAAGPGSRGTRSPAPCWQAGPGARHGLPDRTGPRTRDPDARTADFPEGFLWGTATAAHQIEGGNVNNDWWEFEHDPTSGCVDSERRRLRLLHRWPEDVGPGGRPGTRGLPVLPRVEPDRAGRGGVVDGRPRPLPADLRGLPASGASSRWSPSTTSPPRRWLAARGGWEAPDAPERFARFVRAGRGPPGRRDRLGLHHQRAQRDRA